MKKGIPLALAVIFMAVIGLQMAEPIAAAKIVDKGTLQKQDYKITWKTYQYHKNYLKIKSSITYKGKTRTLWTTLKKVSRTKLRIKHTPVITAPAAPASRFGADTVVTRLTTARYYWRVYRPAWRQQLDTAGTPEIPGTAGVDLIIRMFA